MGIMRLILGSIWMIMAWLIKNRFNLTEREKIVQMELLIKEIKEKIKGIKGNLRSLFDLFVYLHLYSCILWWNYWYILSHIGPICKCWKYNSKIYKDSNNSCIYIIKLINPRKDNKIKWTQDHTITNSANPVSQTQHCTNICYIFSQSGHLYESIYHIGSFTKMNPNMDKINNNFVPSPSQN